MAGNQRSFTLKLLPATKTAKASRFQTNLRSFHALLRFNEIIFLFSINLAGDLLTEQKMSKACIKSLERLGINRP